MLFYSFMSQQIDLQSKSMDSLYVIGVTVMKGLNVFVKSSALDVSLGTK